MKLGILSDTHGYMDDRILHHLESCDEIWHAGDVGEGQILEPLRTVAPVKAVYGNIDHGAVFYDLPERIVETRAGLCIGMIHIGGRPGRYAKGVPGMLSTLQPDIFICGHSHILRVERDPKKHLLYLNPGAAGHHGFHKKRTLVHIWLKEGTIEHMNVVELGKRGKKKA